ncbi:polysaccharide biosynthesis/export family protein [Aquabacterium sp.]|uniref:polysaccharide biosynthesis/export family protein n=1 Tax=Aquabacterium sp. TaxID=1872578 RepID=UPI0025C6B1DD|nr:polysaccharide biosynthesis/export family protein [Aquabacterium sp.]
MIMKKLLIVLSALFMAACTPMGSLTPSRAGYSDHLISPQALSRLPVAPTRVQAGDVLRIVRDAQESAVDVRSLVEDSQSQTYTVRPDGSFSYRYAGRIDAAGKTPDEVAKLLRSKLESTYREPGVTVNIAASPSSKVVIGGAVRTPGPLDINAVATLEQGLFAAGGFLPSANPASVALLRMNEGGVYQLYYLDMSTLIKPVSGGHVAVSLQRGDIVFVPKSSAGNAADGVDLYFNQLLPFTRALGLSLNKNIE